MLKRKFAITHTIGNKEKVIASFDDKNEALAYGEEIYKTFSEGCVSCVQAVFNEDGKMSNHNVRVFEVWNCRK